MVAFVAIIALSSVSLAQAPRTDEAREHNRKGTAAYNLGRYIEAGQEYEKAYELTLDPALLFNVAQAYRLGGDNKKAVTAYRSYLRTAPTGDRRALAEAKVRELEGGIDRDERNGPPAAPEESKSIAVAPQPAAPPDLSGAQASEPIAGLKLESASTRPETDVPLTHRWSFWAVVAAIVVAGVTTAIIVSASSSSTPSAQTTLGTMRF